MRTAADGIFSEELFKGYTQGATVPKSWFVDPFALLDSLGLGYKAAPTSLSYETLRQMAENDVIIAAIIQTRIHQVSSFNRLQPNKYSVGFRIVPKDRTKKLTRSDVDHVRSLEQFVLNCGVGNASDTGRDSFDTYIKQLTRDRLTYDQMCTEVVFRANSLPHSFYAIAAPTVRLAMPKHRKGTPLADAEMDEMQYVQVVDGVIVNTYSPREMGFSVANPRTELRARNYGYSECEMLIRTITSHLWSEEWNRRIFSQGSTTKGILNLKGNIPPQQMEAFKRQWLQQISGVSNAWRTPIINSNDDIQWISLQPTNNDMGFQQWMEYLIKICCAIFLIDPSEINFDIRAGMSQKPMFMTTNEAQQKVSQDRGLRPLLRHLEDHINRHVVEKLDPAYHFEYVGVDAKTEAEAIELRLKELGAYKTLNEIRDFEQLPPVPFGDVIPNPSYIGYRNQKEMAAMQSQQAAPGGMPGGGMPPAGDVSQAPLRHLGEQLEKKPMQRPAIVPDRYRAADETEDWEQTYTASLRHYLQKSPPRSPFDELASGL